MNALKDNPGTEAKVSIVITFYNAERYITETLQSIAGQSYTDYEIVLVDDQSTDSSKALVRSFMDQYPGMNCKLIDNPRKGRVHALQEGVRHSVGVWTSIMDADDLWHRDKLKYQVQTMEQSGCDVLCTSSVLFSRDSEVDSDCSLDHHKREVKRISHRDMLIKNRIVNSSVLYKSEYADYDSSYEERTGKYIQEDYQLWLKLSDMGMQLCELKLPLTYSRVHEYQSFTAKRRFRFALGSIKLMLPYALKHRYYGIIVYRLLRLCVQSLPRYITKYKYYRGQNPSRQAKEN